MFKNKNVKMKNEKSKPCKRVIKSDECERNDITNELWWYKTFDKIEEEFNIPVEERVELLRQALPRQLVNRVTAIYKCNDKKRVPIIDEYNSVKSSEVNLYHFSDETICDPHYKSKKEYNTEGVKHTGPNEKLDIQESDDFIPVCESKVLTAVPELLLSEKYLENDEEDEKCENIGKKNPYTNFFKRPYDRAATWRPLPELSIEQLGLLEKAEAIKEMIAKNFVDWLNSIGGNDKNTITIASIRKMFQVGFRSHAATSLCVRIKEMPSVPDEVARAKFVKSSSYRETLYRHLHNDIKTFAETKDKTYAFGKLLPRDLRIKAPTENIALKWLHGVKVPEELEDMSAVWKGITNLRSTRGFCNWLLHNPDIPKPTYLNQMGMLHQNLKDKRYSLDSRKMMSELQ